MHQEIIDFWFNELNPEQWWKKDLSFDQMINERFGQLHFQAKLGELYEWRKIPEGSLAEIIILDQFSRNIFRDKPEAFACDPMALALAQEAVAKGFDQSLTQTQRLFLYMPYMHSESQKIHEVAVSLFESLGIAQNLDFELQHKAIIDRFGRYPHRNEILGRKSTSEEIEFLQQPNSSF